MDEGIMLLAISLELFIDSSINWFMYCTCFCFSSSLSSSVNALIYSFMLDNNTPSPSWRSSAKRFLSRFSGSMMVLSNFWISSLSFARILRRDSCSMIFCLLACFCRYDLKAIKRRISARIRIVITANRITLLFRNCKRFNSFFCSRSLICFSFLSVSKRVSISAIRWSLSALKMLSCMALNKTWWW